MIEYIRKSSLKTKNTFQSFFPIKTFNLKFKSNEIKLLNKEKINNYKCF